MTNTSPERSQTLLQTLEATLRNQPLLAIGAVVGVGFLVGVAITTQSRPPKRFKSLQNWAGTDFRSRQLERTIDRLENAANRQAPRAYESVRESVSNLPETLSAILAAWQNRASSKFEDVKAAMPDVADIKSAASNAAKKWSK